MAGTGKAHLRDDDDVIIRVDDLVVEFPAAGGRKVHAVSGISFDIRDGETLGLVGESGCGKSTTGRALLQLPPPTSGTVNFDGVELTGLSAAEVRKLRPKLQMIFQDPVSSLNERRTVSDLVGDGLKIWGYPKKEIPGQRRGGPRCRRPRCRAGRQAIPALVLGRTMPADLRCSRAGSGSEGRRLRRTGVGTRRLSAGTNPQPAPGHA